MSEDTENTTVTNPEDEQAENQETESNELSPEKEKEVLMQRAKLLGVKVSNNIGLDTLRERVRDAQEGKQSNEAEDKDTKDTTSQVNPFGSGISSKTGKTKTLRQYMRDEHMKLVRIRVTCMNTKKSDLQGEIFTTANEHLGTVRKFVPYGEATEDGYHVPYCIYNQMKNKVFWQSRTVKDRRTGKERIETTQAKEFNIELLPPLTQEELDRLAISQAAAGSLN